MKCQQRLPYSDTQILVKGDEPIALSGLRKITALDNHRFGRQELVQLRLAPQLVSKFATPSSLQQTPRPGPVADTGRQLFSK